MGAGVHNSIEIQVEIVIFLAIWVGLCRVNRVPDAIDVVGLFFDHRRDDLGVFFGKPSEEGWNTHGVNLLREFEGEMKRGKRGKRGR